MPKPLITVKFRQRLTDYKDGAGPDAKHLGLGDWDDLLVLFPGIDLLRLYTALTVAQIEALHQRAAQYSPGATVPDLLRYYIIEYDATQHDPEDIVAVLRTWPGVVAAYVDRSAPDPAPGEDPYVSFQRYLNPAPEGIDAHHAWRVQGYGEDVRLVEIERGWTLNHEDLREAQISLIGGTLVDDSRGHGTAVLGIACAVENGLGVVGVAPRPGKVKVRSFFDGTYDKIAEAIAHASQQLSAGDIILVEAQAWAAGGLAGPTEIDLADFDAIRLATLAGITVIEPAGNGNHNDRAVDLDNHADATGTRVLWRHANNPGFRESGAILVAAAGAAVPHRRMAWSNHGVRIDCYAWGEAAVSCSSDAYGNTSAYTSSFNGTSAAAAIIAGAALVVQSLAKTHLGRHLRPDELRNILSDPDRGTPPDSPDRMRIGVMPDLRRIATEVFDLPEPEPEPGPIPPVWYPVEVGGEGSSEIGVAGLVFGLLSGIVLGLLLGIALGLFIAS